MLIDSIFAPHCAACDRAIDTRAPLCKFCAESLWPIGVACPLCSLPVEGPAAIGCRACRTRPPPLLATVCPLRYGGELAVAIRRLKYGGRADIARQLAPLFSRPLAALESEIDIMCPMPLHWTREFRRGFNQARALLRYALTRPIRRHKLDTSSLVRTRRTPEQSGLRANERRRNVRGAFAVRRRRRERFRGARVLLFDDVITTGATMAAAARALKAAGAQSVVAFAVARAS